MNIQKSSDTPVSEEPKQRVMAYIDGYNLFYGLKEFGKKKGTRRQYWLNLQNLSMSLLKSNQELVATNYFTTRVSEPYKSRLNQTLFIDATRTLTNLNIFYGQYKYNERTCKNCSDTVRVPTEKMTDVNIATELLMGAVQDSFDVAILITADSDLIPPIRAIKNHFPDKRVIVAFPPHRYSDGLKNAAHGCCHITDSHLARSFFPDKVITPTGYIIGKPVEWV